MFAAQFGKTVKSIVAKLSREGVYVKAVRVTKAGEPIVKKEKMVATIAALIGVNAEKLDGLETAPKAALALITKALTPPAKPEGAEAEAEAEASAEAEAEAFAEKAEAMLAEGGGPAAE